MRSRGTSTAAGRWANESLYVKTITLSHAVELSEIVGVDLQTTFTGGYERRQLEPGTRDRQSNRRRG
jgi:hypothetical protein